LGPLFRGGRFTATSEKRTLLLGKCSIPILGVLLGASGQNDRRKTGRGRNSTVLQSLEKRYFLKRNGNRTQLPVSIKEGIQEKVRRLGRKTKGVGTNEGVCPVRATMETSRKNRRRLSSGEKNKRNIKKRQGTKSSSKIGTLGIKAEPVKGKTLVEGCKG